MSLFSDQARYQPRRPAPKIEEPSQPWTTARCHRLLRPLVSRIASLRKEKSIASQLETSTFKSTSGASLISSINDDPHHGELNTKSEGLMSRKKRPRLTYSQRRGGGPSQSQQAISGQSNCGQPSSGEGTIPPPETKSGVKRTVRCIQPELKQKTTSPGEMVASTPMLRRARGKIVSSPIAPARGLDLDPTQSELGRGRRIKPSSNAQKRLDERLLVLREILPSRYADLEAIYRSLEALLKATTTSTVNGTNVARGPRSFLNMCLRKVSQYITELEAWERLDAEQSGTVSTLDNIDTSAHIYNELESLGTNVGWKHLRTVVRADGVNAVKQGIVEGLFGDEFSQLIIDLCIQLGAASEAEDLVAAFIDRHYPLPLSTESKFIEATAFLPLVVLNYFVRKTQRTSFLFRQYTRLLSNGNLPADWLATSEFEQPWSLATQGLASVRPGHDAISFVTKSISLLSRRKHIPTSKADAHQLDQDMAKASQRRLMSALGMLASMSLLGETELKEPWLSEPDSQRITIIGNKLRYTMKACINGLEGRTRGRGHQKIEIFYLALFFSSRQNQGRRIGNHVRENIGKLFPPVANSQSTKDCRTRNHYDSIIWLITSIARACGRGTSVASHQCLGGLIKQLEPLGIGQDLLDKLKASAAFLIAQQTNNVKDLIYAESLHPHDQSSSNTTSHRQSSSTLFTGYRWEETIGEWVTVSPVMKRRASTMKRHTRPSPSVECTESIVTRSRSSTSLILDGTPDIEMDQSTGLDQEMNSSERNIDERVLNTSNEPSMMMRKRPRRLRSTETLTATLATKVRVTQHNHAISASSRPAESQIDPEKENRVRLLAKKPRRSSGRIVLGARSQSRDSIGQRDGAFSDDELCI
ncbi:hypothetical protein GGR51DRAFT_497908 [Nemania sp. FL0031]|nr:hypothetical protein GGR51DRAFT_497908 [Nemania sp. FL0031]